MDIHTAASLEYATGLDYEEQLLTNWRIINLWLKVPESNKERARKLLNFVVTKAEEHSFDRLLIDAKLQIAANTLVILPSNNKRKKN